MTAEAGNADLCPHIGGHCPILRKNFFSLMTVKPSYTLGWGLQPLTAVPETHSVPEAAVHVIPMLLEYGILL